MARRTIPAAAIPPERAARRRRRLGRRLVALAAAALVVFYGAGGWYYADEIVDGAFVLGPETAPETITVVDLDEATVLLDRPDAVPPGVQGLDGPNGYLQVGAVDADGRRPVLRRWGEVEVGDPVVVDAHALPGDPMEAFRYPFVEVTYPGELGDLDAWYLRGNGDLWMIFVHGRGGSKAEALRLLPFAFDRGYHALVVGYRNDPGLPADPSGTTRYGNTEWRDLAAAVDHARDRGARRIVLVGYSMGGSIVLRYLQRAPTLRRIVAAVLDAPMVDLEATIDDHARRTTLPLLGLPLPRSLTAVAKAVAAWRLRISWDEFDLADDWADLHTPILLFHGTADETVPVGPSRRLAGLRPDLVTLVETDAGHVESWNVDPDAYEGELAAFLDAHL